MVERTHIRTLNKVSYHGSIFVLISFFRVYDGTPLDITIYTFQQHNGVWSYGFTWSQVYLV